MSNRIRLGRSNLAILNGDEDLTHWDEEELRRGRRRDKNGRWVGRDPIVVPKAIHNELVRRTLSEGNLRMNDNLYDAVDLLGTVVRDPAADYRDRITAAKIIVDRVMGKTPERIDVSVGLKAKWEDALDASVVTIAQVGEITDVEWWERPEDDGEGMAPG